MRVGTKSLLFGVHQVLWHPLTVLLAWKKLYGWPTWREAICIFIHDWGYWGCEDMDGAQGENHPYFGASIAGWLFGPAYRALVLMHSRHLSAQLRARPSRLCWADKYSMLYDPRWFYLLRSRATGEIKEYRANAARRQFCPAWASDAEWHFKLVQHLGEMAEQKAKEVRA